MAFTAFLYMETKHLQCFEERTFVSRVVVGEINPCDRPTDFWRNFIVASRSMT